jgi:hypothetical protein
MRCNMRHRTASAEVLAVSLPKVWAAQDAPFLNVTLSLILE